MSSVLESNTCPRMLRLHTRIGELLINLNIAEYHYSIDAFHRLKHNCFVGKIVKHACTIEHFN